MAKIAKMPSSRIISGFKGTIDFYVHMGQPCARKWPSAPPGPRAPAVQAQWQAWAYVAKVWNYISPEIQEAYRLTTASTNLTARDLFSKNFITATYLEIEE